MSDWFSRKPPQFKPAEGDAFLGGRGLGAELPAWSAGGVPEGEADKPEPSIVVTGRPARRQSRAAEKVFGAKPVDAHELSLEAHDDEFGKFLAPNSVVHRMMQKMGFKGRLGKEEQGPANPIQVRIRPQRRGLQSDDSELTAQQKHVKELKERKKAEEGAEIEGEQEAEGPAEKADIPRDLVARRSWKRTAKVNRSLRIEELTLCFPLSDSDSAWGCRSPRCKSRRWRSSWRRIRRRSSWSSI